MQQDRWWSVLLTPGKAEEATWWRPRRKGRVGAHTQQWGLANKGVVNEKSAAVLLGLSGKEEERVSRHGAGE